MEVLLAASNKAWERVGHLSASLASTARGDYRIQTLNLDESIRTVPYADSVVLVHDGSVLETRSFIEQYRELAPEVPVLAIDVPRDGQIIASYLMDGASGCLTNEHGLDDLLHALKMVQTERPYLPPSVQARLLEQFVNVRREFDEVFGVGPTSGLEVLTDREREVLELVAEDLSNREIADRLYLEVGTVKNHVHSILTKLNLRDRKAAASYFQHAQSFAEAMEPDASPAEISVA